MQNKLTDLNNYLFEQLERLNDSELEGEKLIQEMQRAKSVTNVAQAIINNANTMLSASEMVEKYGIENQKSGSLKLLTEG